MNIRLIIVFGLLCLGVPGRAGAEGGWRLLAGLHAGMGKEDVIALLGPAPMKQEYESKRRVAWQYPRARLIFQEGTLLSWESQEQVEHERVSPEPAATSQERVKVSPEAEALLSEILKEIPSDADGGNVAAPAPSRPENAPGSVQLRPIPEDMKFRGEAERD